MGLFDSMKYKDIMIPGCKVVPEESTSSRLVHSCETEKIIGDKTFQAREPVKVVIEGGDITFCEDGHLPSPALEELKSHIKKFIM